MSAEDTTEPRRALERERNRLLEEAAAKQAAAAAIERDMAELDRLAALAAKYNLVLKEAPTSSQGNEPRAADGTVAELARLYLSDERSPLHQIRFMTRDNYKNVIRRIVADCGMMKLAELKAQDIERLYERWTETGKMAMAHRLITMLRMLFGFGAMTLADAECERLSVLMHKMRFSQAKRRSERLTAEQVNDIRRMAHEMKRPSIALAQAFQFDCMLNQKDVIGEWVPLSEPGVSDTLNGGMKWIFGLRWEEIDANLILRHVTSYGAKNLEFDLRRAPTVMEELRHLGQPPTSGPIVKCEGNNLPWSTHEFRRWWRKVADAAGVPKHIKNMDSRPRLTAGPVQGLASEEVRATGGVPSVARN
jgi:hypothetical protein